MKQHSFGLSFFLLTLVWVSLFRADALDPRTEIARYTHDQWTTASGFVGGPVYAFAQTPDGYLWIGTEKGLVRFNGSTFRIFDKSNTREFPVSAVLGLAVDAGGALWVRLRSPTLVRYRNGQFDIPLPNVNSAATTTAMLQRRDGSLLFANGFRILNYRNGVFSTIPWANGAQNLLVISMAETMDDRVWLGTRDSGFFSIGDKQNINVTKDLPERKVDNMVAAGGPQMWIGTDSGVVRWTGSEITKAGVPEVLRRRQILAMLRDRDANIWVGVSDGLLRIAANGAYSWLPRKTEADGRISTIFEDSEGSLWIGTSQGIERFRDDLFTIYSRFENPASQNEGPLYTDEDGRTWFAPSGGGLYWFRGSQVEQIRQDGLTDDVVYSLAGGDGDLWVARQRGGLSRIQYRSQPLKVTTYTSAQGLARSSVASVYVGSDKTIWAGTLSGGLSKLSHGEFTTYTTAAGLASNSVNAIAGTSDHRMWFAGPNGLSMLLNGRWTIFTSADGLPPGNINCLFADSQGVLWIGTDRGVAYLSSGRIGNSAELSQSLLGAVLGITEDKEGWLWMATADRLFRVRRDTLQSGKRFGGGLREFGPADGLSTEGGIKSIVSDAIGRVWISVHHGIAVVDPRRLSQPARNVVPQILNIVADGKSVSLGVPVRVSASRERIAFEYDALSLSAPERVRFRYQLTPYDSSWSEPVRLREADYTHLPPGTYRFQVVASNPDGVWSNRDAAVSLVVEPLFWQSWSFRVAAVLVFALSLILAYRMRLTQLKGQLHLRFEGRLAERNRIAQDLHDTLLQGFMGASMLVNVLADELPKDSEAKAKADRALHVMDRVIEEGRNTLRGLREQEISPGLDQALSKVLEDLAIDHNIEFRMIVEGQQRPLHPVIQDDVYKIGREALVNAFRHSKSQAVEVQLEYGVKFFGLIVRDEGCGIKPDILKLGRDGHWGLFGMRERAERIGARLKVLSRQPGGTEVQLFVPNRVAFENGASGHLWRWFARRKVSFEARK